jgi:glutathione S-transferase
MLLVGGIKYPEIAAGCGVVFLLGRMVFTQGYVTGDPAKRTRGAFGYLGLIGLLGTSVATVYSLVKN